MFLLFLVLSVLLLARLFINHDLRVVGLSGGLAAGKRDNTVPMVYKETLHAGITGSRMEVVPDSGHATPLDQPDYFNRLVLDFIAQH